MQLAWESASLYAACRCNHAIYTRWPTDVDVAKSLLMTVAHAQDLTQLRRLRSVEVRPARTTSAEVLVSLEEVQMHAAVLDPSGARAVAAPAGQFWPHHARSTALLVLDLRARGLALVRTAS